MRKWGWLITAVYSLIVLALLPPAFLFLAAEYPVAASKVREIYGDWGTWAVCGVVILCQILLLWMSVDTSRQHLKPRTPVLISAVTGGFLFMVLVVAFAADLAVIRWDDSPPDWIRWPLIVLAASWILWGILFYRIWKDSADPVTRAVKWLIRGSVLELLVAVPAHVMVRRRHDCCAPGVTALGIVAGIAIMLLGFGPSVLMLLKMRMEKSTRGPVA